MTDMQATRFLRGIGVSDYRSIPTILRMALERSGISNPLVVVRDGQEAIDYLMGEGVYADRTAYPLPGLLLLDLKMPRMNGLDVLGWLRGRAEFNHLPKVVLSSSPDESDIRRAKLAGAQEYFVKPHSLRELIGILQTLRSRCRPARSASP